MLSSFTHCLFALALFAPALHAQLHPVDPRQTHERILAIVPMVGSGKPGDPKKPLFADTPELIGYHAELSDNEQFALVEFVARTRAALSAISPARNARVQIFRKEGPSREAIIREFQKLKPKFNIDNFSLSAN